MSRLSGPITISAEVAEEDGSRRNIVFQVPESDEFFHTIVETRWRKSFAELAWQDQQTKET